MGLLQNGHWVDQWYDTEKSGGRFERQASTFRHWVTTDGSAGPTGDAGFKAEPGRYHLFVSLACPWAHRTLIMRKLKQLENLIGVTVVDPVMLENGWEFNGDQGEDLYGLEYLYELYLKSDRTYQGRVTVPVLWDKQRRCIVNNESAEIIRIFNSAFNSLTGDAQDFYPAGLRDSIDQVNERVYRQLNNGVYRAGFATRQSIYEEAVKEVFECLDWLEQQLQQQDFLCGDHLTEADIRAFTTLIRFEPVYFGHFKCNLRSLQSYPKLWSFVRRIYHWPGVADTVNFNHIKRHYYISHTTINPTGIVPEGPVLDL